MILAAPVDKISTTPPSVVQIVIRLACAYVLEVRGRIFSILINNFLVLNTVLCSNTVVVDKLGSAKRITRDQMKMKNLICIKEDQERHTA